MEPTVLTVTGAALVTALATGLGAAPFAVFRRPSRHWLGLASAVAGGFMLSASLVLFVEGAREGIPRMLVGAVLGAILIALAQRSLHGREDLRVGALHGADARKAVLIVAVMTVHSFAEGIGVGVAFGGDVALGLFITLAIAVHNIPEGLAISLVLIPRGSTVAGAAAWSVVSSLPQPLMALPAFLFVETFDPLLGAGLGFAGGAMLWMVVAEMLPEAREEASDRAIAVALAVAFAAMTLLQLYVLS